MFGRTGQMFPRQRAYHDAIYQEEYGADTSEDCCRSRGLSAVLCWFLSVIILIGLAATVILTVFFILKSRSFVGKSTNGEDIDVLYNFNNGPENDIDSEGSEEHGVSIPPTMPSSTTTTSSSTTTTTTSPRTSTTKAARTEIRPGNSDNNFAFTSPPFSVRKPNWNNKDVFISTTTTSKNTPPVYLSPTTTHRGSPTTMHSQTTQSGDTPWTGTNTKPSPVNNLLDKLRKYNEDSYPKSISREHFGKTSGEIAASDESGQRPFHNHNSPTQTTLTSFEKSNNAANPHLLFTLAPNRVLTHYRRTTRAPRIKSFLPTFSTSSEQYKDLTSSERTLLDLKSRVSPTIEVHLGDHTVSVETAVVHPTTPSSREQDVLYRIIKNLAPKFKNKTANTNPNLFTSRTYTTAAPSTTVKPPDHVTWDHVDEELETGQNLYQEDTSSPGGIYRGSVHPFELVPPPNFTTVYDHSTTAGNDDSDSTTDGHFMDVLVGSEDQKTLITKETEGGVITSAILPPWFNNANETNVLNSTLAEALDISDNATSIEMENKLKINNRTDFNVSTPSTIPGRITADISSLFLNWFSNSPTPYNKSDSSEKQHIKGTKPLHEQKLKPEPKKSAWRELLKGLTPIFPIPPMTTSRPMIFPEPAKNAFHFGTTDGTSDIYGFYSEDPAMAMSHQYGQPHGHPHAHGHPHGHGHSHPGLQPFVKFPGQTHTQPDSHSIERSDEDTETDPMQPAPSHVIDIAFDPKAQPEIIIEPDEGRKDYDGDYMESSASDTHAGQVVVPAPTGGGIRRPMEIIEKFPVISDQVGAESSNSAANEIKVKSSADKKNGASKNTSEEKLATSSTTISTTTSTTTTTEENKIDDTPSSSSISPPIANEDEESPTDDDDDYDFVRVQSHFPSPATAGATADNDLMKRQPITGLDIRGLYPAQLNSSPRDPTSMEEEDAAKPVFEVYPVGAGIGQRQSHDLNSTESSSGSGQTQNSQNLTHLDFVPPKPLSFHSNSYGFSPSVSSGGFLPSGDSWRPVVYDREDREQEREREREQPNVNTIAIANVIQNQNSDRRQQQGNNNYEPPQHRDEFPVLNPVYTFPPVPTKATPSLVVMSSPNSDEDGNGEDRNVHVFMPSTQEPSPASLPIKPSQQIMNPLPLDGPRVKFPLQHQHQQQQQQQHRQELLQNNHVIDRSKYIHRPAAPPIVMRRTPQQSLPFLPNRNQGGRPTAPLFPRVPSLFMNQQHQLKQQQRMKHHMYEQSLMRVQDRRVSGGGANHGNGNGNGNVQWPSENLGIRPGFDQRMPSQGQFPHTQIRRVG